MIQILLDARQSKNRFTLFFLLSALIMVCGAPSVHGSQALLYAIKKDGNTTIFSYDLPTKTISTVFSDAGSDVKLMSRLGSGDSENVIRVVGGKVYAVGKGGPSKAGSLYELNIDGTNQFQRIADIESEIPIARIAVDRLGKKIAYPSLVPDRKSKGEGDSFIVSEIIFQNVTGNKDSNRIDTLKQIGNGLVTYFSFGPNGRLFIRVDHWLGDRRWDYNLFEIDTDGTFRKLPIQLSALKHVVGQTLDGNFILTDLEVKNGTGTNKLVIEDDKGMLIQQHPQIHDGANYQLSSDDQLLAVQGDKQIWIQDLKSDKGQQVPVGQIRDFYDYLTLIGWIDR